MIKDFSEYIKKGIVKEVSPDIERAKSLIENSDRKKRVLKIQIEKIGINKDFANEYILLCYDVLMFLIRAEMLSKGYNATGIGAHEAEVSYFRRLGFNEKETRFLNQMRYFRNGMLYYGTKLDEEYAKKVIDFTKKISSKLKKHLKL